MFEKLSYQITNTLDVNQAVFCYYWKFPKIHKKEKNIIVGGRKHREDVFFFN